MAEILAREFNYQGYGVKTKVVQRRPDDFNHLEPEEQEALVHRGYFYKIDRSKSEKLLGLTYTKDFDKVITDMAYSLIESGVISDHRSKE